MEYYISLSLSSTTTIYITLIREDINNWLLLVLASVLLWFDQTGWLELSFSFQDSHDNKEQSQGNNQENRNNTKYEELKLK